MGLIEDLSTLTTIPENALKQLANKISWIICNEVDDSIKEHNAVTQVDIGIGTLTIYIEENSIRYKFIPGKALEKGLISVCTGSGNPLECAVESTLVSRIMKTYKDLF